MSAFTLAALMMIASGSIHAVVNAILKSGRDKMASRALIDGSSALMVLPAAFLFPLPVGAWHWLAATAVIHSAYLFALVKTFEASDLSVAYPIFRGIAPLLTAAVTIGLLGETATTLQITGIAVTGTGMFVMLIGRHIERHGLVWALITGAMIAAYTVTDSQGVRAAPTPLSFIIWMFMLSGVAIVALFAVISRGAVFAAAKRQWRPGVVAGLLSVLTYGLALYAYSLGPTAPLAALRETGMITATVISIIVLGEKVTISRVVAVVAILVGAVLILS